MKKTQTTSILKKTQTTSILKKTQATSSTLTSGNTVQEGTVLTASTGYTANFQNDGNFVVYDCIGKVLWSSGTNVGSGNYLSMQGDGNLVIYNSKNKPIWSSGTVGKGTAPYTLNMQGDGNLVIYDAKSSPIWSTGTNGKSYTCDGVQLCITTSFTASYTIGGNSWVMLGHGRHQEGYYTCSLYSLVNGANCCTATLSTKNTNFASGAYLDIVNHSPFPTISIDAVSTGDGYSITRFYGGDLNSCLGGATEYNSNVLFDYIADTCYSEFRAYNEDTINECGGNGYTQVGLDNYFAASDAHCGYVYTFDYQMQNHAFLFPS